MRRPCLDLGVTSGAPTDRILRVASVAARSGMYGIWVGEDIGRGYDVFVQASLVMLKAPGKKVGIGVTSPLVHNISTIARAAAALREMGSGRFRLGLGIGGLQDLARLGLTVKKPVALLKDSIDVLRRIWAGETLTIKGENFDLQQFLARYRPGFSIPLYLGVRGPQMLRLAGRIADGVILSGPLAYIEKALKIVRTEAIGRPLKSRLRAVVWLPTLVVRNTADKELAKVVAATVIADTPSSVLEMSQMPEDDVRNVRKTARERGYTAASKHVTERLLDTFTISGDAGYICQVFHSVAKLGADEVIFGPPYGAPIVRSIREVIKAWDRL